MEQKKLVHRDIKPKNIMWDGYFGARVIDFGEAVQYDQSGHLHASAFEEPFQDKQQALPPEALKTNPVSTRRYHKSDVYGVGLAFLQLLVVGDPSQASRDFLLFMEPGNDTAPAEHQIPKVPKGVFMVNSLDMAERLQSLVSHMLNPKPAQRITGTNLADAAMDLFTKFFDTERKCRHAACV